MKRFYLHPGIVTSIYDGQRHLISAQQLMELYHLKPSECCWDGKDMATERYRLINLYPLEDGHYSEEKLLKIIENANK